MCIKIEEYLVEYGQLLVKNQIYIEENAFKMSSAKWQPFSLGLNV